MAEPTLPTALTGKDWLNAAVVLGIVLAASVLRFNGLLDGAEWTRTATLLGIAFVIGASIVGLVNIWTLGAVAKATATLERERAKAGA